MRASIGRKDVKTKMRPAKVTSLALAVCSVLFRSGAGLADGGTFPTIRDVDAYCNIDTSLQSVITAPPIPVGSIVNGVTFDPINHCGPTGDCAGTDQYRVDSITVSLNEGPPVVFSGITHAFDGHVASGTWRTGLLPPSVAEWGCSAPRVGWSFTVSYTPPATLPTPASVSPNIGPTAGGASVTIRGNNFRNPSTVLFRVGSRAEFATNVQFINSQTLTAVTPSNVCGWATVTVSDGPAVANLFEYHNSVTVTEINPRSGLTRGGAEVTIRGTGFDVGPTVDFDGIQASSVRWVDETTITAIAPAHARGSARVRVNTCGSYASMPNAFTYLRPTDILSVLREL